MTTTGYKAVHEFLSCVAVLCGYKKQPRQQRQREVAMAAYHNTFAVMTDEAGTKIGRTGTAGATMARTMRVIVTKHIPTMKQVKKDSEWQVELESEADKLLAFMWWLAWKRREPRMGFKLDEATALVEPDSENEGNFYRIVLTVPVTYVTDVEIPDEDEQRTTGKRAGCPEESRDEGGS